MTGLINLALRVSLLCHTYAQPSTGSKHGQLPSVSIRYVRDGDSTPVGPATSH